MTKNYMTGIKIHKKIIQMIQLNDSQCRGGSRWESSVLDVSEVLQKIIEKIFETNYNKL